VPRNAPTRWLYTRATGRIVTTGELLKKELVERNGFPAARIDSVPTGADPQRFIPGDRTAARKRLGLAQEDTFVGIVARLVDGKGHAFLLEALVGLPQTVALIIVGEGRLRPELQAQVDRLGLRARVRFAGYQADVVPWLQAIDVFALPCCGNEGVPQALIQAMLTGLPCVTTAVGSIPEVARDRQTALIVSPRQAAPLRDAIRNVIDDRELAQRLGMAARRHCEVTYSYKRMLDRMERIYRDVSGRA
jgi:glycosyltransferase involved in cell wall biosynthesis